MGTTEDIRAKKTRKNLYKTVFKLLEEHSIEHISVVDICKAANVHRTTFYSHFEDKFHLLSNAIEDLREQLFDGYSIQSKRMPLRELSHTTVTILVNFIDENKPQINRIFKNNHNEKILEIMREIFQISISDMLSYYSSQIVYRIPLKITAIFLTGGFANLAIAYIKEKNNRITQEEIFEYVDIIMEKSLYIPKEN